MTRTRIVGLLRIALPLVALALLSSLFLLSRTVDPDDALPYATVDVSERARDQQLTRPRFAGVTRGGAAYKLTSDAARPDPAVAGRLSADRTLLVLDSGPGGRSAARADGAVFETERRRVTLEGAVSVGTSTGYDLRTERLVGSLGRLDVRSPGRVEGDGPLGTLRAGAMRLTEDAGTGAQRLLFTGGVEVLYRPPPPSPSPTPATPPATAAPETE